MSLTENLRTKDTLVGQFFARYENKIGARNCLNLLMDGKEIHLPLLAPPFPRSYYPCAGITIEYLISYIANNNYLDFKNTVAGSHDLSIFGIDEQCAPSSEYTILLENVGKPYLDGRKVDELAVYAATALSLLEGLVRSGYLPKSFGQEISSERLSQIEKLPCGKNIYEKKCFWLFDNYCFEILNWPSYVQDILTMVRLFVSAFYNPDGDMYGAKFSVFSKALKFGSAHFDCVIQHNGHQILTDIKATVKPLEKASLRQLIGYALLHDEELDGYSITDVGIYFARSGSFRYLPINELIQQCLPSFNSIEEAKGAFRSSYDHPPSSGY